MILCFCFFFLIKPDPLLFEPPDSCTSSPSHVACFTFLLLCLFHLKLHCTTFHFIYIFCSYSFTYHKFLFILPHRSCLHLLLLVHPNLLLSFPFSLASSFFIFCLFYCFEFSFSPSFHLSVSFPASPSPCSFSVQGSKMLQSKSLLNSYYSGTLTSSHTICLSVF